MANDTQEFPRLEEIFITEEQDPTYSCEKGQLNVRKWMEAAAHAGFASPPVTTSILNDELTPTAAYCIVDAEGGTPKDDIVTINPKNTNDGMEIYLQSLDNNKQITVKHSLQMHGVSLYKKEDIVLTATEWLRLKRIGGRWIQIQEHSFNEMPEITSADAGKPLVVGSDGRITVGLASAPFSPSDKYINITLTNGSIYIAPADGYVAYGRTATLQSQSLNLSLQDSKGDTIILNSPYAGGTGYVVSAYLPCSKGQRVFFNTSLAGAVQFSRFVYAKGYTGE